MPKTIYELAQMLSRRDGISVEAELVAIRDCIKDIECAIFDGNYDEVELILREDLGLEPDYLDILIF